MDTDQVDAIKKLLRIQASLLRGELKSPMELINDLMRAQAAYVPQHFLLPFSSCMRKFIEESRIDKNLLPSMVGSLMNKNLNYRSKNLTKLKDFAERIQKEFSTSTGDTVLAGEGAALARLYDDFGAFPAVHWSALLKDGTYVDERKTRTLKPVNKLLSEEISLEDMTWRKPKPELLITFLAAHVGEAAIPPSPPMWSHLVTALLVWKDRIAVSDLLDMGTSLHQYEEVEHGLAIAAHLMPELKQWANVEQFLIPKWERKYALPLAARRVVLGERD